MGEARNSLGTFKQRLELGSSSFLKMLVGRETHDCFFSPVLEVEETPTLTAWLQAEVKVPELLLGEILTIL